MGVAAAEAMLSQGVSANVVADIRRLAREQGLDLPMAATSYLERARAEPGHAYLRLLQQNPGLRTIGSQGSGYADFMEDAVELATAETAFNTVRAIGVTGVRTLTSTLMSGAAEFNDIAGRAILNSILSVLPEQAAESVRTLDAQFAEAISAAEDRLGVPLTPSNILRDPAAVLDELYDAVDVPPEDRNVVTDIGSALGQFGGQMVLYFLSGGTAALTGSLLMSVDEQTQRVKQADVYGTVEGDTGVLGAAGLNMLIEKLNLGIIFDKLPARMRNRALRILASGTSEGVTEWMQATSANLVALGVYDPETGVFDDAAYEGFLGTVVGFVAGAILPGRPRGAGPDTLPPEINDLLSPDGLQSAVDRAADAQQALEVTRAAIEETATFARDPEAVRELLVAAGDQTVSIPAAEIERLYQEGALTDADIEYLQVEDELTQQGVLSGDVSVPASRVLTLQGEGFAALADHVRSTAGAPTSAEAREAVANREADIERLQGVLDQANNAAAEVDTLTETIGEQLKGTTPLTKGQRRAASRLLAERYAARAALFDGTVTAQSLYERDLVTFETEGRGTQASAPAPVLEQAATPDVELAPDQTVVGPQGLRLLHGTPNANFTLNDLQIVREGAKQSRRGRKTGGFYLTSVADAAQAEGYAAMTGETGQVLDVVIAPGTQILRFDGDVTRISEQQVNEWTSQGYGMVIGKDVRGRTEYVVIDKAAIQSLGAQGVSTLEQAPLVGTGPSVAGQSGSETNQHGLMPHLLVDAAGAREGKALVLASTKNDNAQRQLDGIDEVLARHPDPLASPEAWSAMMADALASEGVPVPPYALIRDVNGDGAAQLLGGMTEGQIADADHGFANAADFRDMYINGEVTPVGTAKLFLWSFLSRGVSPYTQEALFIDGFSGVDAFIDIAAQGQFNYATSRAPYTQYGDDPQKVSLQLYKNAAAAYENLPAKEKARKRKPQRKDADFVIESGEGGALLLTYQQWARLSAPAGSGQPGAGASHNLNAFGKLFLSKMSEDAGLGDGRSRLSVLHDMMSDPTSTGKEVRRQFLRMGQGVGIDNKVVSFTLLVAGYNDVLVLDRVQMRQMWNDGRFDGLNLYDGYKEKGKTVNGSALSNLTYGARGLLIYEAMERSLMDRIATVYQAVGRPEAASIGRYHWETWVASSNQEASHGTIDAIISEIKGNPDPLVGVTAKEGEYGSYAYGARYGRSGAGGAPYFLYEVPRGGLYKFSVPDFVRFQQEIKKSKNGVVPSGFKVTEGNGNAPWYFRSEVSLDGLNAVARANGGAAVEAEILGGDDVADGRDQDISDRRAADQPGPAWTEFEQPAVEPGGTGSYSGGSLAPLEGAPNVVGASGPDPELVAVAERYAADNGIDLRRQAEFVEVDPERAARIAQAYEEMEHAPQDPAVQTAYADLIAQTLAQYQALVDAGYSFTFFDSETDPYAGNPWNAMRDLRANKTMAVYGTYDGYGTEGLTQGAVDANPMLQDTGLVWKDQNDVDRPVTANDLFRAVHDAFGHGIEGAGFRARGEENAWQAHVRLFTGSAVAAITSETRGQNSWLNYGPYGEQNRTAGVEDTVFADQKTGLMPEWTWAEGRAGDASTQEQTSEQPTTLFEQGIVPTPEQLGAASRGGRAETAPDAGATTAPRGDAQQQVSPADLALLETQEGAQEFFARPGWGVVTASLALPDDEFYRNQRENIPALYAISERRQADRNTTENARMQQQLDAQGIPYVVVEGMYKGAADGTSFLIFADEAVVFDLGRAYGQESVLTSNGLTFTQEPQPNIRPTGAVQVGAEAQGQDFFSVLPSGQSVSMALDFGGSGAGVPQIPQGYTVEPTRPQLPVRPDGLVELFHWSGAERTTVDPAFAGTGPLRGEERSRGARLSFYGINPRDGVRDQGTGYVKESGLGSVQHVAFVDPQRLYPWFEDPDGLVAGKDQSAAEAAIKAAGYLGHYTTEDGSGRAPLGNVAAIYEALPVQALPAPTPVFEQPKPGPQTPTSGAVGAPRGSYTLPTNADPRNLIKLSAQADPSTFVHEVGHMFLFQMVRDLADPRLTAEGRTQIEAQISATRAWFGSNADQALSELKAIAKSTAKRAAAAPNNEQLQRRAARLTAAVSRAEAGGGAAYMERVAATFLDPTGVGYDEAAELVFHEQWARGFEVYLGTGSAPSAELRSAFARFASYITDIYKSLRRLNVTVSPEIADVFDRLLATEEAITQERRGATYQISPGVLAGATPAEANELRKLSAEAETEARDLMASRVENSLRREARDARRARREVLANEIAEQVALEPVHAAVTITKTGVMPRGTKTGTGKISREEFVAVFGEPALARMPKGMVSGKVRPANAIPLGDLATLSGFPDMYAMIDELTSDAYKPAAEVTKDRVDAAMAQEFGQDVDPETLRTKAVEVVNNTKFQQLQQLQLRILRRLSGTALARLAQRQAEQQGAPPAAADTAAAAAAQTEQTAAQTPQEGIQAALARIRADVQRTANASQRRAQGAARKQTAKIRLGMDPAAITEAAKRYIQGIKVKDVTPARYMQAAKRLTAKIERAIADRDYTAAASLMEQRALNLEVAKQAAVVQSSVEQRRRRWREVTARSDKRLAQNYSMDWFNAIRLLLEPFGLGRNTPRNYDPAIALASLQGVEPTLFAEIQLALTGYGPRARAAQQANPNNPYKDLTVTEINEIFDAVTAFLANARDSQGILVEGRRVAFEAIATEVDINVSQRKQVQKQARKQERGRGSRRFRETSRQLGAFKASLRRVEQWARDFDNGDPRGPLTRYLVRPVMDAVDQYMVARRGPQEALAALIKGRTDLMSVKPIRATELEGYTFQTKGELIMALLHTGNSSNLRKLLLGGATDVETGRKYVWGEDVDGDLNTARWDAFIARLFADGTLTKADMDLVQGIWDIFDSTKQQAQAAHKKMYGYYFTEVMPEPLSTPVGVYAGGYAPAITDTMMNPDGDRFEAEEVMSQQSNAAMFPGAEKGFTQSRVEYNQPLDLDLTRIPAHFDRVMKFSYLGPAVRQAARLVTNRQFRAAIAPGSPDVIDVAVIPWLQRTVQQRVTTPPTSRGWSGLSTVAAAIDRRVGLHIMAGNIVNAAQQITGFPVAAARIPARHLAVAATRWRVNTQSARAYILSQSPFMEDRLTGGMNEASIALENILTEPGLLNKAQNSAMRYGYFAQQIAQNLVDPTVWLAAERHGMEVVYPTAYADALARTGDEAAADTAALAEVVAYADSVVRDTQAPLRPSDVSGIEASSPLARLFLKFYSYFNAMGNLLVTEKNIAMNSDMGWSGRYGRSFYAYLMIVTIPTIVAESIAQLARSGFDDLEDEDERDQLMFELLIGSQIKTMAAMVPFAGSVVSTAYGIAVTDQIYDDRISLSAGIGVTESTLQGVIRLIAAAIDPNTDVETQRAVKTTLDAMGLALGLPTNWASKPISYAISVKKGDSRPEGFVDIIQGALTGRDGTDR